MPSAGIVPVQKQLFKAKVYGIFAIADASPPGSLRSILSRIRSSRTKSCARTKRSGDNEFSGWEPRRRRVTATTVRGSATLSRSVGSAVAPAVSRILRMREKSRTCFALCPTSLHIRCSAGSDLPISLDQPAIVVTSAALPIMANTAQTTRSTAASSGSVGQE